MVETALQQSPAPEVPKIPSSTIDVVSKSVAAFAIALRGRLSNSLALPRKLWIDGDGSLRPRIAAAGAWFGLFTAVPAFIVAELKKKSLGSATDAGGYVSVL